MSAFDSIIGCEQVKEKLFQICDMMRNKERYQSLDAAIPSGLLLYGMPGIGKTMMAEALIAESGRPALMLRRNKPSKDFMADISQTFDEALKQAPSIVFMDDLDKFSPNDRDREVFMTVQAGLDQVREKDVFVLATANLLTGIPLSLLRAGRFDRQIKVTPPSDAQAEAIFRHYLKGKRLDEGVNQNDLIKLMHGRTCADIKTLLNEAAVYAAYEQKGAISTEHLLNAYFRDLSGVDEETLPFTNRNTHIQATAWHEAGHAVIAEILCPESVGAVCVFPQNDKGIYGQTILCRNLDEYPEQEIMIALAGKAAEEQKTGDASFACEDDVKRAFDTLGGLFSGGYYGVGKVITNERTDSLLRGRSILCIADIRSEAERFLGIVKKLLIQNEGFLTAIDEELISKKVLLFSDIQRIRTANP